MTTAKYFRTSVVVFSVLFTIGLRADVPTTQSTQTLTKIGDKDAEHGVQLNGGVYVHINWKDGTTSLELKSAAVDHSDHYTRGVVVYATQPTPTFVIVADRFASDEDRLIIYDMDDNAKPLTISHDSTDSYSHQHFEVGGLKDDWIEITEDEYAGDGPPRKRSLLLKKSPDGFKITKGKWEKS